MSAQTGAYVAALSATDGTAGVLSLANPEATEVIVSSLILNVTTVATAACSVDAGITTGSSAATVDNLIDGLDVHSATGVFSNIGNGGSNGKAQRLWGATNLLTITSSSGSAAGLVGNAYIKYERV